MLRYSLLLLMFAISASACGQSQFYRLLDQGGQALLDGNIPEAKRSLERALKIMPPDVSLEERSIFYNNLGVVYYQTGEYKKGIDWYEQELGIYRKAGNDSLTAGALYNLGLAYKEIGFYKKAMEYLVRSARVFERLDNQKELSAAWNSMGNIQLDLGEFGKALTYHQRALHLREAIGYTKGIADSYQNIGDVHLAWKHYSKAEIYLLEALRQKKELDNQSNVINTLTSLGKLYVAVGDPKSAYTYLVQAYEAARTIGNSPKAAESMCYLATYYGSIGERSKAVELFHRTQAIARSSSDWRLLRDALQGEITLVEKALPASEIVRKYHELLETKEKVQADLNSKELARLEITYDVERKTDELKLRRKQASIDRLQNQRLTGWLAAVGGIAVFAWVAFYQIRRRKKQIELQKDEIVHLHNELSHRTKNYFSLLSGILSTERKKARNEEVVRMLDVNIHRLDAMSLVQGYLLNNSARSGNKVRLDAYLDHLISELLINLFPDDSALETERNMEMIFLDYDKAMRVAIVLNELMCNAIEHGLTDVERPVLAVSLRQRDSELVLTVRDNGPGMPEDLLQSKAVKGRDLVAKLLYPIGGTIAYRNENGCVAEVVVAL
jgi:two-component sensor histidine kinase/Tfp pilus assembly protein PilF